MNIDNSNYEEFLCNIIENQDFKKELLLEIDNKIFSFSIRYRNYTGNNGEKIFHIYFNDFLKYKDYFKKSKEYKLSITEIFWGFSSGELKCFSKEKLFFICKIIKIRQDFLKTKIFLK